MTVMMMILLLLCLLFCSAAVASDIHNYDPQKIEAVWKRGPDTKSTKNWGGMDSLEAGFEFSPEACHEMKEFTSYIYHTHKKNIAVMKGSYQDLASFEVEKKAKKLMINTKETKSI